MKDENRITKYIKALLAMKAVEIQNKNKIMGLISLSNSYKETI